MIRPANTMETVEHSLMRMFRDGPEATKWTGIGWHDGVYPKRVPHTGQLL